MIAVRTVAIVIPVGCKCGSTEMPTHGLVRASAEFYLLRIPVEQPDFDACSFQPLLKHAEIGAMVVVWNNDFRMECSDRIGRLFGRHRVGQVHADRKSTRLN